MRTRNVFRISGLIAVLAAPLTQAQEEAFVATRVLTAASANKIAVATEAACKKRGFQIAVAVTDRYGNLLAFLRDPLAGAHTITIAEYKAYTAATLQGATLELGPRMTFLQYAPKISLVGGGVPVSVGGYVYGAVGVSGAPAEKKPGDVDDACARDGIKAVQEALEFAG